MASSRKVKVFHKFRKGRQPGFTKRSFSSRASKQECRAKLPNRHYLKWKNILISKKKFSNAFRIRKSSKFASADFSKVIIRKISRKLTSSRANRVPNFDKGAKLLNFKSEPTETKNNTQIIETHEMHKGFIYLYISIGVQSN
jgi:hypothetical protein